MEPRATTPARREDGPQTSQVQFMTELAGLQKLHGRTEPPMALAWQNLAFGIGDKEILKGVTGLVEPGRLTGIMGPSGCGKTTLLNVLSGRQRTSGRERSQGPARQVHMEGKVSVSGAEVQVHQFRSKVAYVFQENALHENETARECLDFSAYLRLPADVSKKDREEYVSGMLKRLHLQDCSDTIVGSSLQKGLSGGEQKRTAVGVELISNPKLLFLDEPLSGLDSYNAYTLMEALKSLAASAVPVLLTLHQPSSEIFAMLDDVLILHDGEVCYHGPAESLVTHFEQLGFPCPANYNPADRVLFLIQKEPADVIRSIKDRWLESGSYQTLLSRIEAASQWSSVCLANESDSESSSSGSDDEWCRAELIHNRHPKGCCATLWALMKRDFRSLNRSCRVIMQQSIIGNLLVAMLYGVLFYRKAVREEADHVCSDELFEAGACQRAFLVHFAVLSMISINVMYAAHGWACEVLQLERDVFLRERAGGYYQVLPYIASKTIYEVPIIYVQCLTMLIGTYWLVGLRGNYFALSLEMEVLALTSASVMYCLSAAASSRAQATALAVLPQIVQFGFSGVLLPIKEVPWFLQWLKWICPLYYGLGLLGVTEFRYLYDERDACQASAGPAWNTTCPGVALRMDGLEAMDVRREHFLWPHLTMCLLLFVVLRLLAVLLLWRKSRYVF